MKKILLSLSIAVLSLVVLNGSVFATGGKSEKKGGNDQGSLMNEQGK